MSVSHGCHTAASLKHSETKQGSYLDAAPIHTQFVARSGLFLRGVLSFLSLLTQKKGFSPVVFPHERPKPRDESKIFLSKYKSLAALY